MLLPSAVRGEGAGGELKAPLQFDWGMMRFWTWCSTPGSESCSASNANCSLGFSISFM